MMQFNLNTSPITVNDITLVIPLRAHDQNPWVVERLRKLNGYYSPQPKILVVDFGSEGEFKDAIADTCAEHGFALKYVEDYGTYSPSIAHNAAFEHVDTSHIFFCDIDFLISRDGFSKLVRCANAAGPHSDTIINLPAYHVSETITKEIEQLATPKEVSDRLESLVFQAHYEGFGQSLQFIAPYSNIFLISKNFLSILGGYCPAFRGHGSEDFEFMLRASHYSRYFPFPAQQERDAYGPMKKDFFGLKDYRGIRSLMQLFANRVERFGLQTFHLWHSISIDTPWRKENDWKRETFREVTSTYIRKEENLLLIDGLARDKKVLCICKTPAHWGYMVALRLHGYEVIPIFGDDAESLAKVDSLISSGDVDAFAIFNPYMKSHAAFYPFFLKARELGLKTIVIERGALPNTIYYAEDVSYAAPSYSEDAFRKVKLTRQDRDYASQYIDALKAGGSMLEAGAQREKTDLKYTALSGLKRKRIFIPLQIHDDMAVTKFLSPTQRYADFRATICDVAANNPDLLFLVKPHPLSKTPFGTYPENVILADTSDNVHALIDASDAVICYNSGVGMLAVAHGVPLITIGNAFYNYGGIGHRAESFEQAVEIFKQGCKPPDNKKVVDLFAFYLRYRYSFFTADDNILEFKDRKAHSYNNIRISRCVLDNDAKELRWERDIRKFSRNSYGFALLNFAPHTQVSPAKPQNTPPKPVAKKPEPVAKTPEKPIIQKTQEADPVKAPEKARPVERLLVKALLPKRKLAKYDYDRTQFFEDSKNAIVRTYWSLRK